MKPVEGGIWIILAIALIGGITIMVGIYLNKDRATSSEKFIRLESLIVWILHYLTGANSIFALHLLSRRHRIARLPSLLVPAIWRLGAYPHRSDSLLARYHSNWRHRMDWD